MRQNKTVSVDALLSVLADLATISGPLHCFLWIWVTVWCHFLPAQGFPFILTRRSASNYLGCCLSGGVFISPHFRRVVQERASRSAVIPLPLRTCFCEMSPLVVPPVCVYNKFFFSCCFQQFDFDVSGCLSDVGFVEFLGLVN